MRHLGYQDYLSQVITLDQQQPAITLPAVMLQSAEKSLKEVRVVVGVVLSGFRNPTKASIDNQARVFNATGVDTARVEALSLSDRVLYNRSANLNYTYKFDSTGRELSMNLDYLSYRSEIDQSLTNTVLAANQPVAKTRLQSSLPSTITIQTAKLISRTKEITVPTSNFKLVLRLMTIFQGGLCRVFSDVDANEVAKVHRAV